MSLSSHLRGLADADIPLFTPRYFQPRIPRSLAVPESVTVRFASYIDSSTFVIYSYDYVEISGENFWEDFIGLMQERTGIRIWDMWLEDDKLYVDLHSTEAAFFDMGSTGSWMRGLLLKAPLASLPFISSFELLVGGAHDVTTSHFNFGTYYVENGEIVGLWRP